MSQFLKIMSTGLCACFLLALVVLPSDSGPFATAEDKPVKRNDVIDYHRMTPAEQRIRAALDAQTEVEFIDTPLLDAMDFIANQHNFTLILDETALADEGIATDEPINRVLSGISLRSTLNIMLKPLGLTYVIDNEVMKITTEVAADEKLETRVYDIRRFAAAGIEPDELAKVITRTVQPKSWKLSVTSITLSPDGKTLVLKHGDRTIEVWDVPTAKKKLVVQEGGSGAAIEVLPGALVISQSQKTHYQIVELLQQLCRHSCAE